MTDLFKELKNYIRFTNIFYIVITIIQAALVVIISIGASNWNNEKWKLALCTAAFIFILISVFNAISSIKFPNKIVEELEAKHKLDDLGSLFDRQSEINHLVCISIQKLNKQTCSLNKESSPSICDDALDKALKDLLQPSIDKIDIILNHKYEKEFLIGVQIDFVPTFKNKELKWTHPIIILRDDLNIREIQETRELSNTDGLKEIDYEFMSSIHRCKNNHSFVTQSFIHNETSYTMICSPIPEICSDSDNSGVFFILFKRTQPIIEDLESVLNIFNRIIINFKDKYSECIHSEYSRYENITGVKKKSTKR